MNLSLVTILVGTALCLHIRIGQNSLSGSLSLDSIHEVLLPMVLGFSENLLPLSRMLATADNGIPSLLYSCNVYNQALLIEVLDFVINKQPDARRYLLPFGCHKRLGEWGLPEDYLLQHRLLPAIPLHSDNLPCAISVMKYIDELDPHGLFRLNEWTVPLYKAMFSEYPQLTQETPIHRYIEEYMIPFSPESENILEWLAEYGLRQTNIVAISGTLAVLLEVSLNAYEEPLEQENLFTSQKCESLIQKLTDHYQKVAENIHEIPITLETLKLRILKSEPVPNQWTDLQQFLTTAPFFDVVQLLHFIATDPVLGENCSAIAGNGRLRLLEQTLPRRKNAALRCLTSSEHLQYFRQRVRRIANGRVFGLANRPLENLGNTLSALADNYLEIPGRIHGCPGAVFLNEWLERYLKVYPSEFQINPATGIISLIKIGTENSKRVITMVLLLKLHFETIYNFDLDTKRTIILCSSSSLQKLARIVYNVPAHC